MSGKTHILRFCLIALSNSCNLEQSPIISLILSVYVLNAPSRSNIIQIALLERLYDSIDVLDRGQDLS